jgi:hypothetical protein
MLNRNMPATYHFGLKFLFDGYLIATSYSTPITLTINSFLFDGHLIKDSI